MKITFFRNFVTNFALCMAVLFFVFLVVELSTSMSPREMAELKKLIDEERKKLLTGKDVAKEEKEKMEQELEKKEEELAKAQYVHVHVH